MACAQWEVTNATSEINSILEITSFFNSMLLTLDLKE